MSAGFRGGAGVGWLLGRLKLDGGIVARSLPVLDLRQTWANSTQVFTGLQLVVTNAASNTASLVARLAVGATNVFETSVTGKTTLRKVNTNFENVIQFEMFRGATSVFSVRDNGGVVVAPGGYLGIGDEVLIISEEVRVGATGALAFSNIPGGAYGTRDTFLRRDAAGILAQRNGTNGQAFRVYRTFTDASNYERVDLDCSSNTFRFGPRALGTGTLRPLYLETGTTTVANLIAAATAGAGARMFVTDANATTFASIVAGGGANGVPVYSDGTNWRIG